MAPDRPGTMAEDYLKLLWKAQERGSGPVSTRQIAETLGVAASSVSGNLRKLDRDGLVEHDPYYSIELTPLGHEVAVGMVRRHRLIETYLVRRLGYSWAEVHEEAEVLEHAVSERFLARIDADLGHPEYDPHGDPIPRADGSMPPTRGELIERLDDGAEGVVTRVFDDDEGLLDYLEEQGIALGDRLRVLARPASGSVVRVELLGPESRVLDLPGTVALAVSLAAPSDLEIPA